MGLFKFQNFSAIKNAQDNPRVIATVESKNGNVFGIKDEDGKELQEVFADVAAAQGEVWVMHNIVDKPEIRNYEDYSVKPGGYIRAFKLNNLIGEKVELSGDLVIEGDIAVNKGVALVPTVSGDATEMVWKTITDPTGYDVYLEITNFTTFGSYTIDGGVGYEAKVKEALKSSI